ATVEAAEKRIAETEDSLDETHKLLATACQITPYRQRLKELPSAQEQSDLVDCLKTELVTTGGAIRNSTIKLAEAESLLAKASEANALSRLWKGLPKPESQLAVFQ